MVGSRACCISLSVVGFAIFPGFSLLPDGRRGGRSDRAAPFEVILRAAVTASPRRVPPSCCLHPRPTSGRSNFGCPGLGSSNSLARIATSGCAAVAPSAPRGTVQVGAPSRAGRPPQPSEQGRCRPSSSDRRRREVHVRGFPPLVSFRHAPCGACTFLPWVCSLFEASDPPARPHFAASPRHRAGVRGSPRGEPKVYRLVRPTLRHPLHLPPKRGNVAHARGRGWQQVAHHRGSQPRHLLPGGLSGRGSALDPKIQERPP